MLYSNNKKKKIKLPHIQKEKKIHEKEKLSIEGMYEIEN